VTSLTLQPRRCEVLVVGSGPAGLFAADQLLQAGIRKVVLVEKGQPMPSRICPPGPGCECKVCDVLDGEGGAGSFSDGKITLSGTRGTHGQELFTEEQVRLLAVVDATVRRFVPDGVDYPPVTVLDALAGHDQAGLRFESYPLLHVGSDGIRAFGERFAHDLRERGVTFLTGTEVTDLTIDDDRVTGAVLRARRSRQSWSIEAGAVVLAAGMTGTAWLEEQLRCAGVILASGPADIGIRLETTAAALAPFIDQFYDFKVAHTSQAGITVRSFCVNGDGFIVNEFHRPLGIRAVNGHSFLDRASGQSNLAILATIETSFTDDPKAYVRRLARDITAGTGGYPVVQPLHGFLPDLPDTAVAQGVEATNAKVRPAALNKLLPPVLLDAFAGYIRALGTVLPPVLSPDSLVYAPEIKYYNYRVPLDTETWESNDVRRLFVVGNAAGYTASLSAAALSGIIAGRAIAASLPTPAR
jgi:uncharacterized FAD-dependent dehydrogenase